MGEIMEVKVRVSPCSSEPGVLITSITTQFIVYEKYYVCACE